MSREIKFRGKALGTGLWIYGSLIDFQDGECAITVDHDKPTWLLVDPETVGQFTGLKDRNGKELYEDDIVRAMDTMFGVSEPKIWKVVFSHGSFVFVNTNGIGRSKSLINIDWMGNIHENPELIEETA